MKIKIPKQVKVAGHVYKIIMDKQLTKKDSDCAAGVAYHHDYIIRLDDGTTRNREYRDEVFVHEVLHAIVEQYLPPSLHKKVDEDIVDMIGKGLYQVWKDM